MEFGLGGGGGFAYPVGAWEGGGGEATAPFAPPPPPALHALTGYSTDAGVQSWIQVLEKDGACLH